MLAAILSNALCCSWGNLEVPRPDGPLDSCLLLVALYLSLTQECCICLSTYEDGAALRGLPCGHHFDQSCLDKWLRNKPTCPLCKYDVVKKCRSGESSSANPSAFGSGDSAGATAGTGAGAGGGAQAPPSLVSTIRATAAGFFESPSQS